jgi:alpha-1,6-mannosyltransferase
MQAMFDLLKFGSSLQYYDHLEFPGVVPRTFIGSLVVSLLSYPGDLLLSYMDFPPLYQQIWCRCALGFISWLSFVHFRNGIEVRFGTRASQLTMLLTAFQFHLCYYMSRTLPNVFALILALNAFAFWLKV